MKNNTYLFRDKTIILWWLLFISFIVSSPVAPQDVFETPSGLYLILNYSSYFFLFLILLNILVNYRSLKRNWVVYSHRFYILLYLMVIVIFCLVRGFLNNDELNYRRILLDFLPFLGCAIALLGLKMKNVFQIYINTFADQMFLAALMGFYLLNTRPITERSDFFTSYYLIQGLLLPVVFLVPSLAYLNTFRKIFVITAYAVICILNIYYQLRVDTFLFMVFIPFITLFALYRRRRVLYTKGMVKSFLIAFLIAVIALPIIYSYLNRNSSLEIAGERTLQRFFGSPLESTGYSGAIGRIRYEMDFIRGPEAAEYISKSTLVDLVIGKGFGGTWDSTMYGKNWHMVHFGPVHLILKGGLLLLAIFMTVYFNAMFLAWKNIPRYHYAIGCFVYLAVRFVQFLSNGEFLHLYDTYIMWLIIGVCFSFEYGSGQKSAKHNMDRNKLA